MWVKAWHLPGYCLGDHYYVWHEPVKVTTEELDAPESDEPVPPEVMEWLQNLEVDLEF